MAAQKERFISGCTKGGMKEASAKKLWEQIETFAAYGFNKAHAVSYGNLAYQTAYMKANFSVDYMAALLTADAGDVDEVGAIVAECKRMGIAVLAPDVNESMRDFTVIDNTTIRFGLGSIKNFGEGVANSIIEARKSGRFASLDEFLARVPDKNLNKKSLEALIQSGAMDAHGERGAMLANIEMLLNYHKEHMKAPTDQDSLFGGGGKDTHALKLAPAPKAAFLQKLVWEKELLGLYVTGHPLDAHKEKLARQKFDIAKTKEKLPPDTQTTLSGIVEFRHEILTKNGEKMAFITIADYGGTIEAVAFPRTLKEHSGALIAGSCVLLKGKTSLRNGEHSFIVDDVRAL
jgi:DNA polymerase-3 subunit alpha